jgi:hypothetical protein
MSERRTGMAAKGQSYAEKFSRWEVLITNGKPAVADIPHVGEDLTALETKLEEVRILDSRREDLRSQAREIGKQIREVARDGEKIRTRLGATLKGKFGFDSETLVKYGFKPRPNIVRRRAKAPETTETPGKPA